MADAVLNAPSIAGQINCVKREIGKRKQVYPRMVAKRQMTERAAQYEIEIMMAVQRTLEGLLK